MELTPVTRQGATSFASWTLHLRHRLTCTTKVLNDSPLPFISAVPALSQCIPLRKLRRRLTHNHPRPKKMEERYSRHWNEDKWDFHLGRFWVNNPIQRKIIPSRAEIVAITVNAPSIRAKALSRLSLALMAWMRNLTEEAHLIDLPDPWPNGWLSFRRSILKLISWRE
jgi:hypothetical protein